MPQSLSRKTCVQVIIGCGVVYVIFNILLLLQPTAIKVNGSCNCRGRPSTVQRPVSTSGKVDVSSFVSGTLGIFNNLSMMTEDTGTLMYGNPRPRKGFLTIGIPSVKRPYGNQYLQGTLKSIVDNSDEEQRKTTTVVILLAGFDTEWNAQTAREIYHSFKPHFDDGFMRTIQAPLHLYPKLNVAKGVEIDPMPRLAWRSKQNIDFAFLMLYCKDIAQYYIQLEDDVISANDFIGDIKRFVEKSKHWKCLEFSELGFIGKLFMDADLENVAHIFLAFYQYRPCDLLLGPLIRLMGQKGPIHHKPALFQHMGKWSSLEKKMMPSVDKNFKDFGKNTLAIHKIPKGNNPTALFETDMLNAKDHKPEYAYSHANNSFFWAKQPIRRNHFSIRYHSPQNITRIIVSTGDAKTKADILVNGVLLVGFTYPCNTNGKNIGTFSEGEFDSKIIGSVIPPKIQCISIKLTRSQRTWLIIRQIEVFL